MRAPRVCAEPGCPTMVTAGKCSTHARPGPRQRGYDTAHDHLRRRWAAKIRTGSVLCWRCGHHITPLEQWDLGHLDDRSAGYAGPEHQFCNRSAAGKEAHA